MRSWRDFLCGENIERGAYRSDRPALTVPCERSTDCVEVGAVLQGKTEKDGAVTRESVELIAIFVIVQKQLADSAIGKPAHGRCEAQAVNFEIE
jgi:hypothetical protein